MTFALSQVSCGGWIVVLVCGIWIVASVLRCVHIWHLVLLHFRLPFVVVLCRCFLDAVRMSRRLGGCFLALMGGLLKVCFMVGSVCSVLYCLVSYLVSLCMCWPW